MLASLRSKLFPCEKVMARLMDSHADSVRKNNEAQERLVAACKNGACDTPKTREDRLRDCLIKTPMVGRH